MEKVIPYKNKRGKYMIATLKQILSIYNNKQKKQLLLLVFIGIIGAIVESLSIGIIVPYMSIIMDPATIRGYPIVGTYIVNWSDSELIIFSSLILLFAFIFKNLFLLFMAYAQAKFIFNQQLKFSISLLRNYLMKPYAYFFSHNVAEAQRNLNTSIQNVMQYVMLHSLWLICEVFVAGVILAFLLYQDPLSTLCIAFLLGGVVFLIYNKQRVAISQHGKNQQDASLEMIKWTYQSINGIKEMKVRENQDFYIKKVLESGKKYAAAGIFNSVIGNVPRLMIETLAVLGLGLVVILNIIQGNALSQTVPTLVLFAAGAYRLMPSFNRGLSYVNNIKFNMASFRNIYSDLLEANSKAWSSDKLAKGIDSNSVSLEWSSVEIEDLSFKYNDNQDFVLKNVYLSIKKGDKIGIIGQSGQGKTTLLDLMLGLLTPTTGRIAIDGKDINKDLSAWHNRIGYIPQNIFLIDDSIVRNIAFGVDDRLINWERIKEITKNLKLDEMIDALPEGLNTIVGDNAICLSGGQKQRIGIARAFYFNPEILILDEATSALDKDTENSVSEILGALDKDKTLILVSHREKTLKYCDFIYKVQDQKIIREKRV